MEAANSNNQERLNFGGKQNINITNNIQKNEIKHTFDLKKDTINYQITQKHQKNT